MIVNILKKTVVLSAILATTGCVAAAVTGAGATGYSIAQERSVGDAVDDATIHTKLAANFWGEKISGLFDSIEIEVNEGRVLLSGRVAKPEDRIKAVKIAWTVEGVKEVINEIQVTDKSSVKSYANDVWLTSKVKTKMLLHKNLKSINYSVDTFNGVVYLMGIAQNQAELERAKKVAEAVSGVKKVVSYVVIKSDPSRKDGQKSPPRNGEYSEEN